MGNGESSLGGRKEGRKEGGDEDEDRLGIKKGRKADMTW